MNSLEFKYSDNLFNTLANKLRDVSYLLGKFSIDSTKVRVPAELCNILDPNISAAFYLVNKQTGEELDEDEYKRTAKWFESGDGISIKIGVEQQTSVKGTIRSFVVFLLSSKILKEDYIRGIDQTNIRVIYDYIIGLNVIDFSYDDFLDASLTDTDIKRDMRRSLVDFEIMKNLAKKYAKSSVSFGTGYRAWWSNTNKGFQFSDRKTTAFRTQPYFKVYHKPTELVNRSNDFYTKYLSNIDLSDVVRYEFTIKNRDHFEYLFGFRDNTFRSFLGLSQKQLMKVQRKAFEKHFLFVKSTDKRLNGLRPATIFLYNFIDYLILNTELSEEQILELARETIASPVARSRAKKKLEQIIYELKVMSKESSDKLEKNNYNYVWFKEQFDMAGDLFMKDKEATSTKNEIMNLSNINTIRQNFTKDQLSSQMKSLVKQLVEVTKRSQLDKFGNKPKDLIAIEKKIENLNSVINSY